jgi:hypothetical protein
MQGAMPPDPALSNLPPWAFLKEDPENDARFYEDAKLVTHIDDAAIAALTGCYRQVLPAGGVVCDLMSSWVSHLPDDVAYGEVIGHGMNAEELAANPRLGRWFVQDLNREPALPLADASLDAALICVGVQYLERPVDVMADIRRTLRPAAPLVISFSNRCFPTKAMRIWLALSDADHARLVQMYLDAAGFGEIEVRRLTDGRFSDPMTAVIGRA